MLADADLQFPGRERLAQIVIHPGRERFFQIIVSVFCGQHEQDAAHVSGTQRASQLQTVHARHHPVDDDQIIFGLGRLRKSADAVFCVIDRESGFEQVVANDLAHIFVVIDYQYMFHLITPSYH